MQQIFIEQLLCAGPTCGGGGGGDMQNTDLSSGNPQEWARPAQEQTGHENVAWLTRGYRCARKLQGYPFNLRRSGMREGFLGDITPKI